MTIFKTGYARATKVLNISGSVKEWDNQAQAFKGNGSTLTAKNNYQCQQCTLIQGDQELTDSIHARGL